MQASNFNLFEFNNEFNYNETSVRNEDQREVRPLEHVFEEESSNVFRCGPKKVSASETQNPSDNQILYDYESNPISFDSK